MLGEIELEKISNVFKKESVVLAAYLLVHISAVIPIDTAILT